MVQSTVLYVQYVYGVCSAQTSVVGSDFLFFLFLLFLPFSFLMVLCERTMPLPRNTGSFSSRVRDIDYIITASAAKIETRLSFENKANLEHEQTSPGPSVPSTWGTQIVTPAARLPLDVTLLDPGLLHVQLLLRELCRYSTVHSTVQ